LRRLVRMLRDDAGAAVALRQAASDDVVYAVLRHHGIVKPSIAERVEAALESIRPILASHGGDVALVRVEPPTVTIRFTGACDNCPASALTIDAAIRTAVRAACPEITNIIQTKGAPGRGDVPAIDAGEWLPAGMVSDIPKGGLRAAVVGGHAVILACEDGTVTCFDDACVHLGAALRDGIVEDHALICPSHGFRYDLRTGACETSPGLTLLAHEVRVAGRRVLIRLAA
jgi:Fe-S cluster biogenesis protein NfuA/nitrite reductase/ring-hydroxylating ferredoxin subunit